MSSVRIPRPFGAQALVLALALVLPAGGCGGGSGGPPPNGGGNAGVCTGGNGSPITIDGTVLYERLTLTSTGLGPPMYTPPARFVDVEIRLAGGGGCYARGHTDAAGNYSIVVTPDLGSTLEVAVFSRTLDDPDHDVTAHDADPPTQDIHSQVDVFAFVSGPIGSASGSTVDLTVPYSSGPANRPAIGFGALDTVITCWDGAEAALGSPLPPLHVYTRLGNNSLLGNTSYYSHTAQAIALLGGAAGLPDTTDSDYFDDPIVAHEFNHFVERTFSHSMSRGGGHGGELLEPNFAWSEGAATGFGCLLLGSDLYIDSTNTLGTGVLFATNVENVTFLDPDGIGGEFTVAEIVWDLGDGGTGPADTDGDPAAVSLAELYAATRSFAAATDAPYVGLFADRLVNLVPSPIGATAMNDLLSGVGSPEDQDIRYPIVRTEDVWPKPITVGGMDTGVLDSRPGGGRNMCRGLESTAWYRLVLVAPAVVNIGLSITPMAGSGDNLDLYLTTNQDVNNAVAFSANVGAAPESINISLGAGTYIIRAEAQSNCFSSGNRAGYTLTVN